jgi:hypothetical protein
VYEVLAKTYPLCTTSQKRVWPLLSNEWSLHVSSLWLELYVFECYQARNIKTLYVHLITYNPATLYARSLPKLTQLHSISEQMWCCKCVEHLAYLCCKYVMYT